MDFPLAKSGNATYNRLRSAMLLAGCAVPLLALGRPCAHPRISSGVPVQKQTVRTQPGSVLRARISPARRPFGKTSNKNSSNNKSDLAGRRVQNPGLKPPGRMPPLNHNDSGGADATKSSYRCDLAFQHAMQSAVAQGLEHPPMIGVMKDIRPLNAPRLFEPVPHSSGCTSPALECADLVPHKD
jgi:hypothetical protein